MSNTPVPSYIGGSLALSSLSVINLKIFGFTVFSSGIDLNNNKIINVSNPTDSQDAATKDYVDETKSSILVMVTQEKVDNGIFRHNRYF